MKHIWTVICRQSILDEETKNISLLNIVEKLTINVSPSAEIEDAKDLSLPINFEIVSLWQKEKKGKENFEVKVILTDPNGKVLNEYIKELSTPADKNRQRYILKSSGLKLTTSGNYTFKVAVKSDGNKRFKTVSVVPLEVVINRN